MRTNVADSDKEQDVLDKLATEIWHIGVKIGMHITDQHPIWLEGESLRRRAELMKVRTQLEEARLLLMNCTREAV